MRGNIDTRLSKLDDASNGIDAIVLSAVALTRLGLHSRIAQYMDAENGGMLHAVGQGAIGIEIRNGD